MLTVKQIEAAKPKEKSYRLADSAGLYLFVPPTGKKVWRMRYRFDGKEQTLVRQIEHRWNVVITHMARR